MDTPPWDHKREVDPFELTYDELRAECDWLWNQLHEERKNADELKSAYSYLIEVASSYRDEYHGFVNSRIPSAWIFLKKCLGDSYDVLQDLIEPSVSRIVDPENSKSLRRAVELALSIPSSNGSSFYSKAPLRVGVITDEFMFNYYQDSLDLVYLSPSNYRKQIDGGNLDFVLYVTCWYGLGYYGDTQDADAMHYRFPKTIDTVFEVLRYARQNGLKVVFQSIEDPTCYESFLPIAKLADAIITSDADSVARYIDDTGSNNVISLPFGVNPMLHNPIGFLLKRMKMEAEGETEVFFAGTWYSQFVDRCQAAGGLFDAVRECGARLLIADRTFHDQTSGQTRFPERYADSIIPPFKHSFLQRIHKAFDWTLNVNTVVDSPTMCAMRAFEVQALGGLVVSNYALSLSNILPSTFLAPVPSEAGSIVSSYCEYDIVDMELQGARTVLSSHTVQQRLNEVFTFLGIDFFFVEKGVYVVCDDKTDLVRKLFEQQTYANKHLVTRTEALLALDDSDEFAIVFDQRALSDENFLLDSMNAYKYVDVDFVAPCEWGDWLRGYNYWVGEPSLTGTLFNLKHVGIQDVCGSSSLGVRSGFFVMTRNRALTNLAADYEIAVIVPIFNNGVFLRDRAWRSLKRSSIFARMHVYLVDDGSTDEETQRIVNMLERDYDNVTVFRFADRGSGSASRPRNKGFDLCNEPFVTYLDPENEAVSDGYAKLLAIIKVEEVDIAFGTVPMFDGFAGYQPVLLRYGETGFIKNPRQSLIASNFNAISVQAAVIRRELLEQNNLSSLEGAIRGDTIFFYELMAYANSAYSIDLPIHVYYADQIGSVVNTIDAEFFEKLYLIEEYAVKFFKKNALFGEYRTKKLDQFIRDWYMDKLERVDAVNRVECEQIIDRIRVLYR